MSAHGIKPQPPRQGCDQSAQNGRSFVEIIEILGKVAMVGMILLYLFSQGENKYVRAFLVAQMLAHEASDAFSETRYQNLLLAPANMKDCWNALPQLSSSYGCAENKFENGFYTVRGGNGEWLFEKSHNGENSFIDSKSSVLAAGAPDVIFKRLCEVKIYGPVPEMMNVICRVSYSMYGFSNEAEDYFVSSPHVF